MNFVKKNLVPLICGVVVLLFIGAYFWPIGAWQAKLQADMAGRAAVIQQAQSAVGTITIPGGATFNHATYEPRIIEAGAKAVDNMDQAAKQLVSRAGDQNRSGRVLTAQEFRAKYPRSTINNNATEVPILGYDPEPNYLPVMTTGVLANPQRFKNHYVALLNRWNTALVGTDKVPGIPPTQTEMQMGFEREQQARMLPAQTGGMFAGGGGAPAQDPQAQQKYERQQITARAASVKMYVDNMALQHRDWWAGAAAPDESRMFHALVDCWFMKDVVRSILDVNQGSRNVGESPIKRLEAIRVGVGPGGTTGGGQMTGALFLAQGQAGQVPGVPAVPAGQDFTRTMTGRVDNDQYDVCLMEVIVDMDPAYQNKFLDALYRQNNGYTVLNIKTLVVDPFDATGNGYLYGNTQVVRLDIIVEGLLYRSWTVPIMPDPIRASLGIPLLPPPGTPAAPAPGAPQ
ncbi:MAG: hypothetical protein ACTHN5_03620 [Phycisphaerae bacterium]